MELIENNENLKKICAKLANEPFICVDLEFMRQHTYFARLCLIQIASQNDAVIIDPLAEGIVLDVFFDLMQNPDIVKVFHSGRQDIEIIYNLSNKVPFPVFDTQIAASAAGYGESVSYENLVSNILHKNIDKSSRLSDWSKRPLNKNQLIYALSDVTHLVHIYQYLKTWLTEQNRIEWINDELQNLCNENLYKISPHEIWQKMRHRSHNAKYLTLLRELAAWREIRAINKNVPRQSFIKDDLLLNICAECPQNKDDLMSVRGMRTDLATGKIGDEIIEVVQKTKLLDESDYVTPPPVYNFSNTDQGLLELLKLLLRIIALENMIIPKLIADEDDLKHFCNGNTVDIPFLSGWRYELFGLAAQKMKNGNTAISYDSQKHRLKFTDLSE